MELREFIIKELNKIKADLRIEANVKDEKAHNYLLGWKDALEEILKEMDKQNKVLQGEIDKTADDINSELAYVIDKIEAMDRELRGQTYAIEFWGGDCYGGFKKNGTPIDVGYSEAVLMTRQEAERIKKMLGTGAIVNRSKTILKNLEDK